MRFYISMIIAILIHTGFILGMAFSSGLSKSSTGHTNRIVSHARIIRISSVSKQAVLQPQRKPKTKAPVKSALAEDAIVRPVKDLDSQSDGAETDQAQSDASATGQAIAGDDIPTIEGNPANYRSNPSPSYPKLSVRMREEGRVLIKALVNKDGTVEKCELATSSGFERLDNSALKAVRTWLFVAQERDGKPVSSWVIIPVVFSLKT